jgi:hypothetical protein
MRGGLRKRLHAVEVPEVASSAKAARAGGLRQRVNPPDAPDNSKRKAAPEGRPLNRLLMRKWCAGKLTCTDVLDFACAAQDQGCPGIERLAITDLHNAARNLIAAVGYPEKAPPIKIIELPGAKPGSKMQLPIICPIDALEKMLSCDRARFETAVRGEPGTIASFWRNLRGHVIYEKGKDRIDPEKSIAVKIHADGAPTTKVDGLMTISWSSLHGRGTTKRTRHVFAVLPKSWCGSDTMDRLLSRLAYAMNALTVGVLPLLDWEGRHNAGAGRQLADGWRLAPIFTGADWEFYSSVCHFPTGQSVPEMCWICGASPDGALGFCHVHRHAGWRATYKTHESYIADCAAKGVEPCALMQIYLLRLEGFLPDAMHGLDEGFTAEVAGNVMYEVMESPGYETNQAKRAARMDSELKAHYKETKETVRIDGKLTYTRVKESTEWPCLKAKAAATRHIMGFVTDLATRHNSGSIHDQRRLVVCTLLQKAYSIMKAGGPFLSDVDRAALKEISVDMMACYRNLSLEATGAGERKWKMKPKLHETQHILEDYTFVNPMLVWLYSDEDLQRIMKAIAVQCHPSTLPYMCLFRWAVGVYGEFDD